MTGVPGRSPTPIIRPLSTEAEARECAELMSSSDPWKKLGRTFEASLRILHDPAREVYVALEDTTVRQPQVVGFVIVIMQGAFVGYIQTVAVRNGFRGRGVGSALMRFAEQRIFREKPNVFICVSSFNPDARRLYERLGYAVVGELPEFIIRGHSELLLRKTIGPLAEWTGESGIGNRE